jgi:hypothetical protein
VANNPTAQYTRGGHGALADSGRNTLQAPATKNIDLAVYKDLSFTEKYHFRVGAQFANVINHPQYLPGTNLGFGLGVTMLPATARPQAPIRPTSTLHDTIQQSEDCLCQQRSHGCPRRKVHILALTPVRNNIRGAASMGPVKDQMQIESFVHTSLGDFGLADATGTPRKDPPSGLIAGPI